MSDLESINLYKRISQITPDRQMAFAIYCSKLVIPLFKKVRPNESSILESAIDKCWNFVKGRTSECNYEEIAAEVSQAVPDSEDAPDAGAAIPAGETIIALLTAAANFSSSNIQEVIQCAFAAIEMNEYIKSDKHTNGGGALMSELKSSYTALKKADSVNYFIHDLDEILVALENGIQPTKLNS